MLRPLIACGTAVLLGGCFQPMKHSDGHLGRSEPPPVTRIPAPVQTLPVPLPRPKPPLETFSVTVHDVPARELLFALARDARLNVDIHPGITGTVTLNAIDQTLPQLLERISKQVDMRYELDGPNLVVMPDTPYLRIYRIDYVNMQREARGSVSISGNILSASAAGTQAETSSPNASTLTVQNVAVNHFWDTLEKNVEAILRETDKILPASANVAAVDANVVPGTMFREAASVISNREAGLLTVRATARQHEKIQEYLDLVLANAKRQVLIEATIVEVRLNRNYQQGIDWNAFLRGSAGFSGSISSEVPARGIDEPLPGVFTLDYTSEDFTARIKLLDQFGTLRVLSSPRVSVLNNQTAVLKVVENLVYFTVEASTSQTESSTLSTVNTTPHSVSVGFIMNVTPQIDGNGNVLLNLKPTISRVSGAVPDPNPTLRNPCGAIDPCPDRGIVSSIPQIQQRELESVIHLRSGEIAVMGGLIEDAVDAVDDTVPGLNGIPLIGELFAGKNQANSKTELVIFIRPVVVDDPSLDGDYRGYRSFLPGDDFMREPHPARTLRGAGRS
ncbi:MAG: type II and III secretion system protein [Pseudomonadota bacterium]|mgnify:CR=1 FL=1|nr:MAG: type II and III secretion system protein [Pseudomonadota bacterium]